MIHDLTELYTTKRAVINHGGTGVEAIVAAVTGKPITVISYVITEAAGAAAAFTWKSATTAISGAMALGSRASLVVPESKRGYLQTAAGAALNIDSASALTGHLTYIDWTSGRAQTE